MSPKANISLPDGTKIEIDGSLEEVRRLTEQYGRVSGPIPHKATREISAGARALASDESNEQLDIAAIVSIVRECDEAEAIETNVLDQRDVLNRVLLCLWVVHKYVSQTMGLTSGDIERITEQLGVKVGISNASTILSGRAKAYVTGDTVRKKGATVRYRLNRRGVVNFEAVLKRSRAPA